MEGVIRAPTLVVIGCCKNASFAAGPATTIVTVTVATEVPIVTEHVLLPEVQPELIVSPVVAQVVMAEPLFTAAVKLTTSLLFKLALQVPEFAPAVSVQLNSGDGAPVLVTEPLPLPEKVSVRGLLSVKVFCAWNPDVPPVAVK